MILNTLFDLYGWSCFVFFLYSLLRYKENLFYKRFYDFLRKEFVLQKLIIIIFSVLVGIPTLIYVKFNQKIGPLGSAAFYLLIYFISSTNMFLLFFFCYFFLH